MHPAEFVFAPGEYDHYSRSKMGAFYVGDLTTQNVSPESYGHGAVYVEDE